MTDEALRAELVRAQRLAAETACPLCRGRGCVAAGQTAGEFIVLVRHFALCPRRPDRRAGDRGS